MARPRKDSKKIQATFTLKQLELIRSYKGVLGEDDAEIIKGIVTNWLLEKSFYKQSGGNKK